MPTRILREGIVSSERVNKLSEKAEVFYRRLMSVADDYGRFFAHPAILRTACYPLRLDRVAESDINPLLDECRDASLITFYRSGKYLQLVDFKQQTRSPSKFPEPTKDELLSKCKSNDKHLSRVVGVEDVVVGVVVGEGVDRKEGVVHPSLEQVKTRALMTTMPEPDAVAFWNHFESSGWIDKHGHPIVRWEAKMDNWKTNTRAMSYEAGQRNGSANHANRNARPLDLKTIIEAKQSLANDLKAKHSSDVAMGTTWDNQAKADEYTALRREIKALKVQLSRMA